MYLGCRADGLGVFWVQGLGVGRVLSLEFWGLALRVLRVYCLGSGSIQGGGV